jgi:hypothetical protein
LVEVGVELPELVWFPVAEAPEVTVEDIAKLVEEADAVEGVESPVAVEAAVPPPPAVVVGAGTKTPAEVDSLIPQTASASKVNAIFLALHSLFCRIIESRFIAKTTLLAASSFALIDEWSTIVDLSKIDLPGKTLGLQFLPMQQKYASRYCFLSHMHAASLVQEPPGKLSK